jgi:hypothetical protein
MKKYVWSPGAKSKVHRTYAIVTERETYTACGWKIKPDWVWSDAEPLNQRCKRCFAGLENNR